MSKRQGNNRPHQRCAASTTMLTSVENGCSELVLAAKHATPISNLVLGPGVLWPIPTGFIKLLNFDLEDDAAAFLLTS